MPASRLRSWLEGVLRRRRVERDMADEMAFHLQARRDHWAQQGLPPAEAARRARLEFGAVDRYKDDCRQARGLRWLDELRADLTYARRTLVASPVFTLVAVAILAIAIGANTAMFSVVEAVMLRRLPVVRPHELRELAWIEPPARAWHISYDGSSERLADGGRLMTSFAYPIYTQLRDRSTAFASLFLFATREVNLDTGGRARQASAIAVSANFLDGLGTTPLVGRGLRAEDDRVDAPHVVVLSHRLWQSAFGADPRVLGRTIRVNATPAIVVGVTRPSFEGVEPGRGYDVLLPIASFADVLERPGRLADAHQWVFRVMGRLRPGVDDVRASVETDALLRQALPPDLAQSGQGQQPRLVLNPGGQGIDRLRRSYARPLYLLTAIMVAVLCIACANVAGLLLVRTAARQREMAMRLALGAGRGRLVRQLLTESLILAALGACAGGVLAFLVRGSLLPALNRDEAPIELALGLSPWVLAFSIGMCLIVGLGCGILPALRATPADARLASGRTVSGGGTGGSRLAAGRTLIALQVALSLVLLVGAALFTRTLLNLRSQPLGFRLDGLLLARMDATTAGYKDRRLLDFYETVLERVSAIPGVQAAAFSRWGLLEGGSTRDGIRMLDAPAGREDVGVHVHYVSPGYFSTMGIPLLAGRDVSAQDRETAPRVAIVNQALARQIAAAAAASVVGRRFGYDSPDKPLAIVGVVADAHFASLRQPAPPTIYLPYRQHRQHRMTFAVRVARDPGGVADAIRLAVAGVDPDVPLFGVRTQAEQIHLSVRQERVFAWLASSFGLLALLLACLGVYGTLAYSVTRRTPEIGLRMALGATRPQVVSLFLRESLGPVVVGAAAGIAGAVATSRFLESLLFEVRPRDAGTIAGTTLALVAAALLAAWLPSRRASGVDPVTALRCE
jgi:predicted permease